MHVFFFHNNKGDASPFETIEKKNILYVTYEQIIKKYFFRKNWFVTFVKWGIDWIFVAAQKSCFFFFAQSETSISLAPMEKRFSLFLSQTLRCVCNGNSLFFRQKHIGDDEAAAAQEKSPSLPAATHFSCARKVSSTAWKIPDGVGLRFSKYAIRFSFTKTKKTKKNIFSLQSQFFKLIFAIKKNLPSYIYRQIASHNPLEGRRRSVSLYYRFE